MTPRRLPAVAIALLLAAFRPALAQTGTELVERGVAAYRDLNLDQAAALLRRALEAPAAAGVGDSLRATAHVYLGAVEHFRGRRREAADAFRGALAVDPLYRPDTLVFPPAVTAAFDDARRETAFIRIAAPADTTITLGDGIYVVPVHASALHEITVVLTDVAGRVTHSLYTGPIVDSLEVRWDGTVSDGAPLTGAVDVRVVSRPRAGGQRIVRLPLIVRALHNDTLLLPPPPGETQLRPEREAMRPAFEPLLAGLLIGVGAALLPALATDEGNGTSLRFAVGGVLGAAGVFGFMRQSRGRAIPDNVRANALVRDAWRRDVEAVRSENIRRRGQVRIRISAGTQAVVESDQ